MFVRQLMFAAFVGAVLASAGCSCCRGTRASYTPPCGCGPAVPAGPVAVPAIPAPVAAGYVTSAPCPTCVGR
jgi:hypothetical protein